MWHSPGCRHFIVFRRQTGVYPPHLVKSTVARARYIRRMNYLIPINPFNRHAASPSLASVLTQPAIKGNVQNRGEYNLYPSRKSAQRSPIMMLGAFVLPEVTAGMTEASATRSPSTP